MSIPVYFIVDTTHPAFPTARVVMRGQHEGFDRGKLSITQHQAGVLAIVKVLELNDRWRGAVVGVGGLVQQVLVGRAEHAAWVRAVYNVQASGWRPAEDFEVGV